MAPPRSERMEPGKSASETPVWQETALQGAVSQRTLQRVMLGKETGESAGFKRRRRRKAVGVGVGVEVGDGVLVGFVPPLPEHQGLLEQRALGTQVSPQ